MRNTHCLLTLALGALASTSSMAQSSVTLYGAIDAGVGYTTNVTAKGDSVTTVNSGGFLPSIWGVSGTEDLGGGSKAFFKLENSFNVDTGTTATATSFFNRFAHVGLAGSWGTLTIGRLGGVQYDYTVLGTYDPGYGATYGLASLNPVPIQILKINNSVKYQTAAYSGFSGTAMYSFGQESAGNSKAGRYIGGAIEYVNDKFRTRVTYEKMNGGITTVDQSNLSDKRLSAAARYDIGGFELYADYVKVKGDLPLSPLGEIYMGSVGYKFTPVIRLVAQAGQYNLDAGDKVRYGSLLATYNLSKRTLLYSTVARVINGNASNFGTAYLAVTSTRGQDQTTAALGMRHAF
ncbi:MAG: porin [Pseudomonadota bacterium]